MLHGDLQHANILCSGEGWLAIDPKGLFGEPAYECSALLYNPWPICDRPQLAAMIDRRIAILAERLDLDRRRIRDWGLVQAVLSAWWSYDAEGNDAEAVRRARRAAGALSTLRH